MKDFGATNEADTCLWCGCKLYRSGAFRELGETGPKKFSFDGRKGYRGSGLFCSLNCGYGFGLSAARGGVRLKRKGG